MSGGPVVDKSYERVIGILSSKYTTETSADRDLAFAVPLAAFVETLLEYTDIQSLGTNPRNPSQQTDESKDVFAELDGMKSELSMVFQLSAVLLLLEQFSDGGWGRTLWKASGSEFTKDVAPDEASLKTKRAISVTSWAGQALFKATSMNDLRSQQLAREFISRHHHEKTGAFGYIYAEKISGPYLSGSSFFRGNPRHTATAIKYLEVVEGLSRTVVDGVEYLIKYQHGQGGWGETETDEPNTLSTAYVIDVISKLSRTVGFSRLLSTRIENRLVPGLNRGLAWLAENFNSSERCWHYLGQAKLAPLYTVHVLAFAPDLAAAFPEVTNAAIESTISRMKDGGCVEAESGPPSVGDDRALCLCVA